MSIQKQTHDNDRMRKSNYVKQILHSFSNNRLGLVQHDNSPIRFLNESLDIKGKRHDLSPCMNTKSYQKSVSQLLPVLEKGVLPNLPLEFERYKRSLHCIVSSCIVSQPDEEGRADLEDISGKQEEHPE